MATALFERRTRWLAATAVKHGLETLETTDTSIPGIKNTRLYVGEYYADTTGEDRARATFFTPNTPAYEALYEMVNPAQPFAEATRLKHLPVRMVEDAQVGTPDPVWTVEIEEAESDDPLIVFRRVFNDGHSVSILIPYECVQDIPDLYTSGFDDVIEQARYVAEARVAEPYDTIAEYYGTK